MITITYEKLVAALALFTTCCVAGGWLAKIITEIRKPGLTVAKMLDNDNKRINKLRADMDKLNDAMRLLMKSNLILLDHMGEGNHVGEMNKMEEEIRDFLLN